MNCSVWKKKVMTTKKKHNKLNIKTFHFIEWKWMDLPKKKNCLPKVNRISNNKKNDFCISACMPFGILNGSYLLKVVQKRSSDGCCCSYSFEIFTYASINREFSLFFGLCFGTEEETIIRREFLHQPFYLFLAMYVEKIRLSIQYSIIICDCQCMRQSYENDFTIVSNKMLVIGCI